MNKSYIRLFCKVNFRMRGKLKKRPRADLIERFDLSRKSLYHSVITYH